MTSISLCCFVKNEENCIANMLQSVIHEVSEIIIVDTGCTDKTIERALEVYQDTLPSVYEREMYCGKTFTVVKHDFINFGETRTFAAHQATCDWVLMLDADETLSYPRMLRSTISQGSLAYAFPRRRWFDREMTKQIELEAYPDWQVRLFKNNKSFSFKRELHEYFDGAAVHNFEAGPVIEHFHDVYKTEEQLTIRSKLYAELSVLAGVSVEGGHPIEKKD